MPFWTTLTPSWFPSPSSSNCLRLMWLATSDSLTQHYMSSLVGRGIQPYLVSMALTFLLMVASVARPVSGTLVDTWTALMPSSSLDSVMTMLVVCQHCSRGRPRLPSIPKLGMFLPTFHTVRNWPVSLEVRMEVRRV